MQQTRVINYKIRVVVLFMILFLVWGLSFDNNIYSRITEANIIETKKTARRSF